MIIAPSFARAAVLTAPAPTAAPWPLLLAADQGGARPTPSPCVLVVDDDPDVRQMICDVLGLMLEGTPIVTADNGAEALDVLDRESPAVILLDMRMPVMDGWQFADRYRQLPGPHAPVVVLTAAPDAARWAAEIRADAHLGKPFEVEQLLATVQRFVNGGGGGSTVN